MASIAPAPLGTPIFDTYRIHSQWGRWFQLTRAAVASRTPAVSTVIKSVGVSGRRGTFDVSVPRWMSVGSPVTVRHVAAPVPSKGNARDEIEMDPIIATGYVVSVGTLRVHWASAARSIIVGDVAFGFTASQ